ncbi:MAG TPA: NADH-quinone oxidoreductase subunit C [Bacillota bacterium]
MSEEQRNEAQGQGEGADRPAQSEAAKGGRSAEDAAQQAGKGAAEADAAAAAKQQALEKAKAMAAAKAKAAAAAKAKAAAGEGGAAPAKPAAKEPPAIPQHFQPLLDGLRQRFADFDPKPEFNPADGYLYIDVPAERLLDVGAYLRDEFGLNYLRNLSGVDWEQKLQVVYHLVPVVPDGQAQLLVGLRVDADRDSPEIPSVVSIWETANWHEREVLDLFGIRFRGHPNPRRILLPDHWQGGYPLRKDFVDKRPKKQRKVRPR